MNNENFKGTITKESSVPSMKSPDEAQPFKRSFDTPTALTGMYLWLLFGFFSTLIGCDLQRLVSNNMYVKHLVALVTFFFLMTVIDSENDVGIVDTWIKTLIVYVLFLMSTKSKILASITVLIILIIDQTIKIHIQYILKHNPERNITHLNTIREYLYIVLVAVIIIGYIHYFIRARLEFGDKFNYNKFIFGTVHCFHHDYA